jgi:NDP-sugar pyrophosphorylase family protein
MNRSVLNYIPIDEFYDMPELIENLKNQKKNIFVFSIREYWSDIGTMNDLLKARS